MSNNQNYRNPQLTGSRVVGNSKLNVFADFQYHGLEFMLGVGPFCDQHLSRLYQTTMRAVGDHHKTLAIRFDLRLPDNYDDSEYMLNQVIGRFFESLKAKIAHDRQRARQCTPKSHDSRLRYVWSQGSLDQEPLWHCIIFLNEDTYPNLGAVDAEQEAICSCIHSAWVGALQLGLCETRSLVFFPQNACYHLSARPDSNFHHGEIEGLEALFKRASYICKLDTKQYGRRAHGFGSSRS